MRNSREIESTFFELCVSHYCLPGHINNKISVFERIFFVTHSGTEPHYLHCTPAQFVRAYCAAQQKAASWPTSQELNETCRNSAILIVKKFDFNIGFLTERGFIIHTRQISKFILFFLSCFSSQDWDLKSYLYLNARHCICDMAGRIDLSRRTHILHQCEYSRHVMLRFDILKM